MKIPAVTIKYNKYLDEYVTFFLENSKRAKDSGWGAWKKKNENDIIKKVIAFQGAWKKHKKLKEFYKKTYPESEFDETYSHILVYAVHSKIYDKYFPDRKDVDIKRSAKHGNRGYSIAWDIVTREGSDNIISEFKKWNKKTAPHIVRR